VSAGQYSDPEAEAYLIKTLIERRDKIGRHWFGKVNPLDEFEYSFTGNGASVTFTDLSVKYGFASAGASEYRFRIKHDAQILLPWRGIDGTSFTISTADLDAARASFDPAAAETDPRERLYEVEMTTRRNNGRWSNPTVIWLAIDPSDSSFAMVGIEHLD
jgi:hypothetical protein